MTATASELHATVDLRHVTSRPAPASGFKPRKLERLVSIVTERHELRQFLEQVSNEMAAEYRRIYGRAAEDPGTAGDEGEENWAKLLREWLPASLHVEAKAASSHTTGERARR